MFRALFCALISNPGASLVFPSFEICVEASFLNSKLSRLGRLAMAICQDCVLLSIHVCELVSLVFELLATNVALIILCILIAGSIFVF